MSRYNPPKKRTMLWQSPLIRVMLGIIGILLLWILARTIVQHHTQSIPQIYSDVVQDTITASFSSKSSLRARVTELESTISGQSAALTALMVYKDENEKLKAELGRVTAQKGILATVITEPNRSFYDTFLIDAGSAEGIHLNQTAYAFNTIALGMITKVNAHNATVTLFSHSGQQTTGTAAGSDVAVTLVGRGGGEYEVRIPRDVHFEIGGSIVMQSTQTAVLATIQKIVTDPRDPFQRILAKAPVNLQTLKWVVVR